MGGRHGCIARQVVGGPSWRPSRPAPPVSGPAPRAWQRPPGEPPSNRPSTCGKLGPTNTRSMPERAFTRAAVPLHRGERVGGQNQGVCGRLRTTTSSNRRSARRRLGPHRRRARRGGSAHHQRRPPLVLVVPLSAAIALDEALSKVVGGRADEAFRALGRRSAETNLPKLQANFLKGKTPQKFLAQTPSIYRLYYEGGAREYQPTTERAGIITTTGTWPGGIASRSWAGMSARLSSAAAPTCVYRTPSAKRAEGRSAVMTSIGTNNARAPSS